jgi:hypothetical protein
VEAGKEGLGAFEGRVEIGSVWLGVYAALVGVPQGVEEVAPRGASAIEPGGAFWIRAHYARGPLWLAVVPPGEHAPGQEEAQAIFRLMSGVAKRSVAEVGDVRVFRPR